MLFLISQSGPELNSVILASWQFFFHSETLELVYAIAGALLFSAFIVFDTHMLMHKLSPEEYILASINLYLDIINLFVEILRILDAMKKHWTDHRQATAQNRVVVVAYNALLCRWLDQIYEAAIESTIRQGEKVDCSPSYSILQNKLYCWSPIDFQLFSPTLSC